MRVVEIQRSIEVGCGLQKYKGVQKWDAGCKNIKEYRSGMRVRGVFTKIDKKVQRRAYCYSIIVLKILSDLAE